MLHLRAPHPLPPTAIIRRHPIAHQHARARRRLEHVVHAFDAQGRALLVRARPDDLGDALALLAGDPGAGVFWRGGVRGGGAEVGFAADEDDGDGGAADGADFFYPLGKCNAKDVRGERRGRGWYGYGGVGVNEPLL